MSINHLNIEQATSSIEVVSSSVIDKLYELALNPSLDSGSNIQGNLQVTHAYQDAVDYLLNKFPGLQINVTGGAYIRFKDSTVESLCASTWGDGTGITRTKAAIPTVLTSVFVNNTIITSFNEFKYFTNITTLPSYPYSFLGCTALTEIDLSNITLLSGVDGYHRGGFEGCTSLKTVILNPTLTAIGFNAFINCTSLENIDLPSTVTIIYDSAFYGCTALKSIDLSNVTMIRSSGFYNNRSLTSVDLTNVTYLGINVFTYAPITKVYMPNAVTVGDGIDGYNWGPFSYCTSLLTAEFGTNTATIGWGCLRGCTSLKYVIVRSTTPPTMYENAFESTNNCNIYVPDASVASYKEATNWSSYASRIHSLTLFAIDFPNG